MAELERSERLVTEKYNQTKAQLAEFEGECERMKVTLKQKDKETEELKKVRVLEQDAVRHSRRVFTDDRFRVGLRFTFHAVSRTSVLPPSFLSCWSD